MAAAKRSKTSSKSPSGDVIQAIPAIPPGLLEAAQSSNLIPFIGAGVSRMAGCPGWNEFADGALSQLVGQAGISYAHVAQLANLNPRVKLSIARILARERLINLDFRKLIHPGNRRDNVKGRRLYGLLSQLSSRFVTTNYDEWLHSDLSAAASVALAPVAQSSIAPTGTRKSFFRASELTAAALATPNCVLHLHGSLEVETEMILTTQDYVRHYANDRASSSENYVLTFLEHLFSKKTVLFIGYGLEELEILEYVILKAKQLTSAGASEARHYLLQGFFSHEIEFVRSLERYYLEECGIQLIPFLRDTLNYDQLLLVIEALAQRAPASNPLLLQDFTEMEGLLK